MSVETTKYMGAARRFIAAAGRRVAEGDEPEMKDLVGLELELDRAFVVAVDGWLAMGRSFTHVGDALGISRQAARIRYERAARRVSGKDG